MRPQRTDLNFKSQSVRNTCPNCGQWCGEDAFCNGKCEREFLGDLDVDYGDICPGDESDPPKDA